MQTDIDVERFYKTNNYLKEFIDSSDAKSKQIVLINGYVRSIEKLLHNQIIPNSVTVICFELYYISMYIILICKIVDSPIVCEIVVCFVKFKISSDEILDKMSSRRNLVYKDFLQNTCRLKSKTSSDICKELHCLRFWIAEGNLG